MTQNKKDILLKDLCARLPYGVKVHFSGWDSEYLQQKEMVDTLYSIDSDGYCNTDEYDSLLELGNIKPYLFPLSSMTDEQIMHAPDPIHVCDLEDLRYDNIWTKLNIRFPDLIDLINWLLKNHFDIYGLIPMGLAIDATGLNIY